MKAIKFRIENYKSIRDSWECYFADKFTILAGKNESGKTSILEALSDFHENSKITEDKKPLWQDNIIPKITVTFELSPEDIKDIIDDKKLALEVPKSNIELDIEKSFDTNAYTISNPWILKFTQPRTWEQIKPEIDAKFSTISQTTFPIEISNEEPGNITQKIWPRISKNQFINNNNQREIMQVQTKTTLTEILSLIDAHINNIPQDKLFIEEFIKSKLPYFILFSSFDDIFPDRIETIKLKDNEWAKDLSEISDFNPEKMAHSDKQTQSNHQSCVNAEFTEKFHKYRTQDPIKLEVEKDGNIVYFWIVENGVRYKPSQRSKGQQRYLSFYVRIVARISNKRPNLILIDEPWLYLHAKAQKDILKVLDEQNFKYPVIFSTHSPYLITEDKLGDIRLVEKDNRETKIVGKIRSKVSDGETLTPVLTAIGLGINDSITNLDQKNNLVAEGMEETFYLRAFYQLIKQRNSPSINIISGGGTTQNMGKIGAILDGWWCYVYYVLDNDKAGKKGKIELQKLNISDEQILFVSDDDDDMTIDLLDIDDFKRYVLEDEEEIVDKNSKYLEEHKKDKVLFARKFLNNVNIGHVTLSEASMGRIKKLFSKINFNFSDPI